MEIINCFWEEDNIGEKTCELNIYNEVINKTVIKQLMSEYKYIVARTDTQNFSLSKELEELGFYFIENQFSLSINSTAINYDDFIIKNFLKKSDIHECKSVSEVEQLLNDIDDTMFSTDRIALDKYYGLSIANKRYRNWIKNSFNKPEIKLFYIIYKKQNVGFGMLKENGTNIDYLLGGIFSKFKMGGLGILVPLVPYLYLQSKKRTGIIRTKVSSNNIEIIKCYINCNYRIVDMKYIFVKHN